MFPLPYPCFGKLLQFMSWGMFEDMCRPSCSIGNTAGTCHHLVVMGFCIQQHLFSLMHRIYLGSWDAILADFQRFWATWKEFASCLTILSNFKQFCAILANLGTLKALEALLGALGEFLSGLGAFLGRLGALLGRFWPLLGRSWGALGASWGALGRILGPLSCILGTKSSGIHLLRPF